MRRLKNQRKQKKHNAKQYTTAKTWKIQKKRFGPKKKLQEALVCCDPLTQGTCSWSKFASNVRWPTLSFSCQKQEFRKWLITNFNIVLTLSQLNSDGSDVVPWSYIRVLAAETSWFGPEIFATWILADLRKHKVYTDCEPFTLRPSASIALLLTSSVALTTRQTNKRLLGTRKHKKKMDRRTTAGVSLKDPWHFSNSAVTIRRSLPLLVPSFEANP